MTDRTLSTRFDETAIDSIFAAIDQSQLPGGAVAIAIDGVPVYRKGFGRANLELPALLTPSMRMRIGSTTKHFACLAYMLLCEEGRAGIDDEIGRYVPGLQPIVAQATMRRLMGHTSGIRDLLAVTMTTNGVNRPVTDREMIDYYRTIDDRDFEPGTRWSYNNGGYILLTAAIEAISGERLEDVLRKRILAPAGMHDTMLRRWDSDFVPNSATLHAREADGSWSRTYMGMEISGAGGMVSTMDDMLRWLRQLDAPVIGSAETWTLMREPQRLANGQSTDYGLGLIGNLYRGARTLHHAGGVMGGNSQMIKVPGAGLDISIAVNRSDVSASMLAYQVIDACVEGLDPLPEKTETEKKSGIFVSARDGRVAVLSVVEDQQMLSIDGSPAMPMTADAAGVLHLPAAAAFLQQTLRFDGDAIELSDFGNVDRLTAIEPDAAAKLGQRAGAYRADTIDATLTLSEDDKGAHAAMRGRHGQADYKLVPIDATRWRLEHATQPQLAGIVTFEDNGLRLDLTRMRDVRFARL